VRRSTLGARQIRDPRYREIGTPGQPDFLNGARNYSPAYSTASFLKDGEGFVHLKGTVVANAASEGAEAPDVVIFTLPPGYRPRRILDIATVASTSTGFVYVHPNGDVEVGRPTPGEANYGLDSIRRRRARRTAKAARRPSQAKGGDEAGSS
jgi:hypothetical protein